MRLAQIPELITIPLQIGTGLPPGYQARDYTAGDYSYEYSLAVDGHLECGLGRESSCGGGGGLGPRFRPGADHPLRSFMEEFEFKIGPHTHLEKDGLEGALGVEAMWLVSDALQINVRCDLSLDGFDAYRGSLSVSEYSGSYFWHSAEDDLLPQHGLEFRYTFNRSTPNGTPLDSYLILQTTWSTIGLSNVGVGYGMLIGSGAHQQ